MTVQTPEQIERDVRTFRDHFIPIGRLDLVRTLTNELAASKETPSRSDQFGQAVAHLASRLESHYRKALNEIIDDYSVFDPDCILIDLELPQEGTREQRRSDFFRRLEHSLERANFRKLPREEISLAVKAAKALGVRLVVNFDAFAHLSVWVRGEHIDRWTVRRWYRFYRREEIDVPVHRRLVLIFQDHPDSKRHDADQNAIFLKIFKNIPCTDVDTLLPSSRIQLSWFDRGKILFPTISGIGLSLAKIAKTSLVAMLFGGIYGLLAFIALVGAGIGYSLKSFFGYLHTKDKYQLNLTRHLYYQNLGNNVGVLFRLIHEAEQQEFREALLAYWILLQQPDGKCLTKRELDSQAEAWIEKTLGVSVDFEDDDALNKLVRFGMAEQVAHDQWRALPVA